MNDLNFSPWGTRVFWAAFALLMIGVCLAVFSPSGLAAWLGVAEPKPWIRFWGKWIVAVAFFAALFLAHLAASLFDHMLNRRRLAAEQRETYVLTQ